MLELTFGISREIYANFLALREATEKEHDLDRVLPLILPRIVRGLGIALLVGAGDRDRASAWSSRAGPPGGWRRCATPPTASATAISACASRRAATTSWTSWRARSTHGRRAGRRALAPRLPAEGVGLAGGRAAAGARDQEPADADPARGAGAGLEVQGDDPAYRRLLATAQEILNEEVGAIRRLVDDFSAFAKLPKVEPAPRRSGPGRRGLRARAPRVAGVPARRAAPAGGRAVRSDAAPRVLANLVENAVQAAEATRAQAGDPDRGRRTARPTAARA